MTHTRTYQILVSSGYMRDTGDRFRVVTAYVVIYPDGTVISQDLCDWHCWQHRCRVSDLTGEPALLVRPIVYDRVY